MNITGVNLPLPLANQSQAPASLAVGQTILAQVVKLEGNQVVLQWGANLLRAYTKTDLKTGERLKLQVGSSRPGMIELKIIGGSDAVRPGHSILPELGLELREQMEALARQFVKFNLPLSREGLMEIYNLIRQNPSIENLSQLLVWLKSIGIKAESEQDMQALQELQRFLKGGSTGDEEQKFFRFLNTSEPQMVGGYNIFGWPLGPHHIYLVQRGSGYERAAADQCQVFIRIESRSMEELWFKLELIEQNLNVEVICNSDKYKATLEKEIDNLKKSLQSDGYRLKQMPIVVRPLQITILDLLPDQEICNVDVKI